MTEPRDARRKKEIGMEFEVKRVWGPTGPRWKWKPGTWLGTVAGTTRDLTGWYGHHISEEEAIEAAEKVAAARFDAGER